MTKYLKSIAAALVVVLAFNIGTIRKADAHFADAAMIVAAISALQSALTYAIQYWTSVYLNTTVQQASAQASAESEKIVATIAETARGQEVVRAQNQLQRDAAQVSEAMKLPPFACQTLAASDATAKTADGARDTASSFTQALDKRGTETTNSAAEMGALYYEIQKAKQGAPVNATTLLSPKTYTPEQEASAQAFVKAVTDPTPIEKLPDSWANTPQGRAFSFEQQVYQERMSLAQQALAESFADRKSQSGAGTMAGLANPDASAHEIALSEVEKRVMLPDWKKSIMAQYSDPLPILKEIALMMGQSLYIEQKSADRLERMEAIMATNLAMRVRQVEEPQLRAQREIVAKTMGGK
jgi:hypothetical protein